MKQRIFTGAALVAFMILLFFSRTVTLYVFDAFVVYLGIVGGLEMSKLLSKIGFYNSKICVFVYPILSYGLFKICELNKLSLSIIIALEVALVIVISAVVAIVSAIMRGKSDNEIKTRKLNCSIEQFSLFKAIQTMFAMLYPGLIVTALFYLNNLLNFKYLFNATNSTLFHISLFALLYTFIIPVFIDTFAMLTGRLFKGKKLCEKISPNKTISGAVGGFVWGVFGAILLFVILNSIEVFRVAFMYTNIVWWHFVILGVISGILCQLGDIFESYLKRKANVKDSGDFLPGHGGLLDRIDSHLVNILIIFVYICIIL